MFFICCFALCFAIGFFCVCCCLFAFSIHRSHCLKAPAHPAVPSQAGGRCCGETGDKSRLWPTRGRCWGSSGGWQPPPGPQAPALSLRGRKKSTNKPPPSPGAQGVPNKLRPVRSPFGYTVRCSDPAAAPRPDHSAASRAWRRRESPQGRRRGEESGRARPVPSPLRPPGRPAPPLTSQRPFPPPPAAVPRGGAWLPPRPLSSSSSPFTSPPPPSSTLPRCCCPSPAAPASTSRWRPARVATDGECRCRRPSAAASPPPAAGCTCGVSSARGGNARPGGAWARPPACAPRPSHLTPAVLWGGPAPWGQKWR